MTISTTANSITYGGNGVTTSWPYGFLIPASNDVEVIYTSSTGVQTVLSTSQYSISGIGNPTGGAVIYPLSGSPIPTGSKIGITRVLPLVQGTSISSQGPTFAAIESALDYEMMCIQETNAQADLAIRAPISDVGLNYVLPPAVQRANAYVAFDSQGNVITTNGGPGTVPISTVMQPVVEATSTQEALELLGSTISLVNIATLRAFADTTTPPAIYVLGFSPIGDGGQGLFVYEATDTTSSDNGGTIIVDAANRRWHRDYAGNTLFATWFGATGSSGTDCTSAVQACLNAGGAASTTVLPAGVNLISSTLLLTQNDQKLIGPGAGDLHDTGTVIVAPCSLRWNGSSGGTMVKVASTTSQYIAGNVVSGIFFDGNSGRAGIGFNLISGRIGTYEVVGAHFTTSIAQLDVNGSLSEPAGCTENLFLRISGYQTNVGDGSHLIENSNATWDCSNNTFLLISGDYLNGNAIINNGCDSELYQYIKLYCAGGTGSGLVFTAGPTTMQASRNNIAYYVGITNAAVPVFCQGTSYGTFPSNENNILFLDTANNPNLPSLDTGATLWFGTTKTPIGTRAFSRSVGVLDQTDASGLITQCGISGTVPTGGSTTITFATAFPAGDITVSVTPKTSPTIFSAAASSNSLTILNASGAGAASTDFYWEVKGF